MKLLIAHDSALIRAGLRCVLSEEFDTLDVTQTPTALENLDLDAGPWDLAFVGFEGPDHKGLHFIRALKRAYPVQPVIALSYRANLSHAEIIPTNFIQGSIAVESTTGDVVTAVHSVIAGYGTCPLKEAAEAPSKAPALSTREQHVLRLLAGGQSVKQVAAALSLSASSVSTYRVRILRKLQLSSTAELIGYAFRNHLVD